MDTFLNTPLQDVGANTGKGVGNGVTCGQFSVYDF